MLRTLLLTFAILVAILSCPVYAQTNTSPSGMHLPPLAEESQGMGVPMKTEDQVNQERLQKYRILRQEEIRRDTAKLYQLTGELKDYLDKNGSTILSLDMIKKAETIEKLAHSVKQRMKETP